ncbi:MAG: RNA pseudouridine synthase [Deltaproteobacteria bacterium]|nr:RNA pseudouridine synthase [Deltaproteobacteria bacterium]
MSPKIIYEDDALIMVEKPAGMSSTLQNSVEEWLQKKFPKAKLVHRLDNDTSGLMVAAKDEATFEKLRAIWKTDGVVKKYTALVLGRTPSHGIITTPIAHHARKKKKMMTGGEKARPAHTEYKTIKHFKNFSLIEVQITTGVRHQIRMHMASIGHPLAGDRLYQKSKKEEDTTGLTRHFLHLSHLELLGKTFHSEPPQDLKDGIASLRSQ